VQAVDDPLSRRPTPVDDLGNHRRLEHTYYRYTDTFVNQELVELPVRLELLYQIN